MRILFILAACFWTCIAFADPNVTYDHIPAVGIGNDRCDQWVNSKGIVDKDMDAKAANWIGGFFSGFNVFKANGTPFYMWFDEKNLIVAVRGMCSQRPKKVIVEVAWEFVRRNRNLSKPK